MKYFKDFLKHVQENTFVLPPNLRAPSDADGTKVSKPTASTPVTPPKVGTDSDGTKVAVSTPTTTDVTPIDTGTKSTDKAAEVPLQNKLKEWSQKYSQAFKFINDKPFTTEVTKDFKGQYEMLLNVVVAEKKQAVQEAILSLINILEDKRFAGYTVQIIGHTSTPGPKGREAAYNLSLSQRRSAIVYHALQDKSTELKKNLSAIKFEQIGKGLTDPIILNDKVLEPLKLKQMDGEFNATTLDAFSKSVEERQKINRRVIVTLPNYKEPVPVIKVAPVVKSQDERFEKIAVKGVEFMDDSYVLTEDAKKVLTNIAAQIDKRASSTQKIQTMYLSAHTEAAHKKSENNEKMMYILSLNRGLIVEKFITALLKNKIKFVRYACAGLLPTQNGDQSGFSGDKRVQILFDDDLPNAKKVYEQLSDKYKLPVGGQLVPNDTMKQSIIRDINAYFEDDQLRQEMVDTSIKKVERKDYFKKIPREFWIPNSTYQSLGEAEPEEFVDEVESIFRKMNNKYETSLKPSVIFHDDLKQQVSKDGK